MKNKIITILVILSVFCMVLGAHAEDTKFDKDLTDKIEKIIKDINTIKPGMTRSDLLKIFTMEGGLSTRTWRRYVYWKCPYIKVDVEFKPIEDEKEKFQQNPGDIIVKISQPFLEFSIID
jgi:hypothetical protein